MFSILKKKTPEMTENGFAIVSKKEGWTYDDLKTIKKLGFTTIAKDTKHPEHLILPGAFSYEMLVELYSVYNGEFTTDINTLPFMPTGINFEPAEAIAA